MRALKISDPSYELMDITLLVTDEHDIANE